MRGWLILIVAVGALLRLFPVWFGLPYLGARPDEEVATRIALAVLDGDPHPRFFHWPSLTFYTFAGLFRISHAVRSALGWDGAPSPAEYLLIARTFIALAGTATLVVLFWLGRRIAGTTAALLAAALLAVAMLHVRDSHFAMTDVLMTFLVTSSLALLVRAMGDLQAMRWFVLAGLTGGLAASTKYNAAAVVASMAALQVLTFVRAPRDVVHVRAWLPSVAFVGMFLVGFVVATPYAVLDYGAFSTDLWFDFTHLSEGHNINLGRGWTYHLTHSLPFGLGVTAFAASILGILPLARHHHRHALVLGSFLIALYVSIGSGFTVFFRYILPLLPVLCLVAAVGIEHLAGWLSSRARLSHSFALALLAALTIGPGLVNSVWFDVVLARTDTRVIAGAWLDRRLQPHHVVRDAGGSPYASLELSHPLQRMGADTPTATSGRAEHEPEWLVLYDSPLFTYGRSPYAMRDLAQRKYVLAHVVRATRPSRRSAVYDLQDAFFVPVWGFWTVERPGPTIHIYKRRDVP